MRPNRLLPVLLLLLTAQTASAQIARRQFLFKDARAELAAARARGDKDALLIIASMPGANATVAKTITALGGTIQYRSDDVDYLRARVPVEKVETLAVDKSVHSFSISPRPNTAGGGGGGGGETTISATDTTKKRLWPPPLLSWYPVTNRYDPLGDLRALDFRKQNPTFDGRGVTLAIIDMSLDPLLPELQSAFTLDGQPVQKIIGYETAIDSEEEPEGRWLAMKDVVTATGTEIRYKDKTYTAPRAGTFKIDLLDEAVFDSLSRNGLQKDLNRDGNPQGSSRLFAVLWDEATGDVWVDTNQDNNFSNDKALTDFRTRPEFGVFGRISPRHPCVSRWASVCRSTR
jgi:hypothetical protein